MFQALFGFQGRLGRLPFLGWNLAGMALVTAIAVAFLMLGAALSVLLSGIKGAPTFLGMLTALTCGVVGSWVTLALAAKRIRDIGLAPLPLIVGVTVLLAVDYWILARLTEVRFFAPFANYTPVGGILAVAWMVFLICWPGVSEPDSDTPGNREPGAGPASRLDRAQFGRRG